MSKDRYKLKFTRVMPIKRPDCIMSSAARESGNYGFIPSYEKDVRICTGFVMTNEYLRMWMRERAIYEKDVYSSLEAEKDKGRIRRRYVLRDMTKKKPDKMRDMPIITLKRFQNIKPKTCLPRIENTPDEKKEEAKNDKKNEPKEEVNE
ncbi:uncharacterized protein LOC108737262 [Agrilus planipennis]|uniref:Uncharacterized protein LOC108737262 n=1 Tax=Agrilus planipennis TaxID=224129 RepID=A0A1W4WZC5_AGRPL|nr:uncharacterized protein LOC108737262 [Agrilus planipennis]